MMRKQTNTIDIKAKVNLTMSLKKQFFAVIAVISLVFGSDGGVAPSTA